MKAAGFDAIRIARQRTGRAIDPRQRGSRSGRRRRHFRRSVGNDPALESRGRGLFAPPRRRSARASTSSFRSTCAPRHWRGFDAAMKNGALRLEARPTLTRGEHKSGRKLYVEMTFALVIAAGRRQGRLLVAPHVTERVEREREVAAASNLPPASRGPYAVGDEHPESQEIWPRCQRFSGPRQARAHVRRRRARREGRSSPRRSRRSAKSPRRRSTLIA